MKRDKRLVLEGRVKVDMSIFKGYTDEMHAFFYPVEVGSVVDHIEDIVAAIKTIDFSGFRFVFKRLYASDIYTVSASVGKFQQIVPSDEVEVTLLQQRPLSGNRIVLYAYLVKTENQQINSSQGLTIHKRSAYTDFWFSNAESNDHSNSFDQTYGIFKDVQVRLEKFKLTVADNLIRTWLFVNNVDKNYSGVVLARKKFFDENGLTKDTHYIASTGIEGTSPRLPAFVTMDALAIDGLQPEQVEYVSALTHLNPTHEYGVAFERATVVTYGDRRHFYLSGTASINNSGEVVHLGDVLKQTQRAIENIDALLHSARFTRSDMAYFIVYVRDIADYPVIQDLLSVEFRDIPFVVVEAAVCRPGWLIEIEGEGIQHADTAFAPF